jgi:sortase A
MTPVSEWTTQPGQIHRGPTRPGVHSHNLRRRTNSARPRRPFLRALRLLFLLAGLAGLGYYGYSVADQYVYQSYSNWAFDQEIAGHHVTFTDYLRSETPLRYVLPLPPFAPTIAKSPATTSEPGPAAPPRPAAGDLLGRLEIPRLNLSAVVREGVDDDTLRRAVGHIPSTALPGEAGNFSIAAHRDTLFRALKDIRKDDRVTFQSENRTFTYEVVSTQIVKPTDVSVLNPEPDQAHSGTDLAPTPRKTLTMITCYPFNFVGSAPNRFIVKARLVEGQPDAEAAPPPVRSKPDAQPAAEPSAAKPIARAGPSQKPLSLARNRPRNSRGLSHSANQNQMADVTTSSDSTRRHPGLWRKLAKVFGRHSD